VRRKCFQIGLRARSSAVVRAGNGKGDGILFIILGDTIFKFEIANFTTKLSKIMTDSFNELEELRVTIDRVIYMPHLEAPLNRPHPFVYFITIRNGSNQAVTIKAANGS